jgi:hypothetical protein
MGINNYEYPGYPISIPFFTRSRVNQTRTDPKSKFLQFPDHLDRICYKFFIVNSTKTSSKPNSHVIQRLLSCILSRDTYGPSCSNASQTTIYRIVLNPQALNLLKWTYGYYFLSIILTPVLLNVTNRKGGTHFTSIQIQRSSYIPTLLTSQLHPFPKPILQMSLHPSIPFWNLPLNSDIIPITA